MGETDLCTEIRMVVISDSAGSSAGCGPVGDPESLKRGLHAMRYAVVAGQREGIH
jgi:hypothetical protein